MPHYVMMEPVAERYWNAPMNTLLERHDELGRDLRGKEDWESRREHDICFLEMRKIRGLMVARGDRLTPPFEIGTHVVCTNEAEAVRCSAVDQKPIPVGLTSRVTDFTVDVKTREWLISIREASDFALFPASCFEKIEKQATTPA